MSLCPGDTEHTAHGPQGAWPLAGDVDFRDTEYLLRVNSTKRYDTKIESSGKSQLFKHKVAVDFLELIKGVFLRL